MPVHFSSVRAARSGLHYNYKVGVLASDITSKGANAKSWPYEYIYKIKPYSSGATTFQTAPTDMAIFEDNSYVVYYYSNYQYFSQSPQGKIPVHTYNPFGYFSYTNPAAPATPTMYAFDAPDVIEQKVYDKMKLDVLNQYVYALTLSSYPLFKNPNKGDIAHDPVKENLGTPAKHTFYIICDSDNPDGTAPIIGA